MPLISLQGSKDPFALRRAAIGVLRLNEHPLLQFDLAQWVNQAFDGQPVEATDDARATVMQFINDRERVRLMETGYPHDLVVAVQAINGLSTANTENRVKALETFSGNPGFQSVVATNKRVVNLLKESELNTTEIQASLFEHPSESALYESVMNISSRVADAVSRETFPEAITALLAMTPAADDFFENVMVNADNQAVRANRLQLCRSVREVYRLVADFSLVQQ